MTTVQTVFEISMTLLDSISDAGVADIPDNKEYKNKTVGLLNILLPECYLASDTYATTAGSRTRPTLPLLTAMTDEIPLDDAVCRNVLPFGLASLFFGAENNPLASFYQQKYQENLAHLKATVPATISAITDVYFADNE